MKSRYALIVEVVAILTLLFMLVNSRAVFAAEEPEGLVGRWDFDDGTGKDLSGNGNDAVLGGGTIYPLGKGHACIRFMPDADSMLRLPELLNASRS